MLDQQHRLLIDHINLLEEVLQSTNFTREEADFAVNLVDYLDAYAKIHFNGEEKCMDSYRCPAHAQNQQEHEQFRDFIRNYNRLFELEGFKVENLRMLHGVMQNWITEHILKVDTQIRPCIPASLRGISGAVPAS